MLNAALTQHQEGLLQLWIMSATMPDLIFDSLVAVPHDVVDLVGMPFGLRVAKVRCDQANWLPVSKAIIEEVRQLGYSSLMFVTSPQERGDYAKTEKSETVSGEVRHAIILVHGRQNREYSDKKLCADVGEDEARTYVATDSLGK